MNDFHTSVLLQEVIDFLNVKPGNKYVDATVGGGGHTFEILRRGGLVLGIDWDQEAIEYIQDKLKTQNSKNWELLTLVKGNFREVGKLARENGFGKINGIIFDLGVSSYQLNNAERGFSFRQEGPLDMRMNPSASSGQVTAADLINGLNKGELYELFSKLGEERFALAISNSIVGARGIKPIETTTELAQIVRRVYGSHSSKIDPATRVFQALRISVNDELNNLREALFQGVELLNESGRIEVISFHSLEDRLVKEAFSIFQEKGVGRILTKKPVIPDIEEIKKNRRSRSAKLRVFEKT